MNGARIAGASSLIYFCSRYDRPKANLRALVGDTMPSTSTPFARAEPALMLSADFEGALVLSPHARPDAAVLPVACSCMSENLDRQSAVFNSPYTQHVTTCTFAPAQLSAPFS